MMLPIFSSAGPRDRGSFGDRCGTVNAGGGEFVKWFTESARNVGAISEDVTELSLLAAS